MKKITNQVIEGKHQKPILLDVFFEETSQPKPIIIFCHGYKGFKDWGAWNLMASEFAKAGFFFIKFNFSYNGGTAEQPINFPDLEAFGNNNYTKELDDVEAVADWIFHNTDFKNEANCNEISLIGHSRGGGIVLLKSNEDIRIKKVITLAGVSDFESRFPKNDDFQKWKEKGVYYLKNGRTHQEMPHFYQFFEDFEKNKHRLNIKKAIENLQIPHLILHGNNDTSVLISEAENLKKWQPKSAFTIIENADHVFNVSHPWNKKEMSKELTEVTAICIDFLR
ncbi:alpha/beta hydrolase family protein [Polaribacter gangjinensis]|uniref:Alpha/beta hydrolase n=1 Tax=Polaribacter gangjinensis TaxID=574710 RepID=A0A2S7WD06_9FLAO|nr:alpha/beta fold hydrolase [Polaribacter gangjinensis]PQJ75493.1 alpha/beta hydrolase [Polaribacter gangjinensis]